ncbi:hypothetical protein [Sandarakinorhabdus sp.]|uniref:hypothetical protein n=1 Tax=Sandarakinorhabdus sp. TaxID=1916663 RepID=UPI003F7186F0
MTEAIDMSPAPQQVQVDAMTRWGDDGGAVPPAKNAAIPATGTESGAPDLTNAELVKLRVRVIALENLLIALLADVSQGQLAKVRAMADHITPRDGQTPHALTISAASHMLSLLHRAEQWSSDDSQAAGN